MMSWCRVGTLALAVTWLTMNVAVAATPSPQTDRAWLRTPAKHQAGPAPSPGYSYGKWALVLLVLGVGGWAIYRRRSSLAGAPVPTITKMRVTAATRLSSKAQIVAIQVQGRTLLVGVTDAQITRLGWLDDDDLAPELTEDDAFPEAPAPVVPNRSQSPSRQLSQRETRGQQPAEKREGGVVLRAKTSRFREVLADAIGLPPKRIAAEPRVPRAPVDELVDAAEDRYVGRDARQTQTDLVRREPTRKSAMIDVEGQAQGLVARLNRQQT